MKKYPYLTPESIALELHLDSGCLIGASLLGDDTEPDMPIEDIGDPFETMQMTELL